MVLVVLFGGFCVWFYLCVYRKWGYYGKFVFKSILLVHTLVYTVILIFSMFYTVPMIYEEQKANKVSSRLERIQYIMNKGDYCEVANVMDLYENYEKEFDYIWERLRLYACYEQYLVFKGATENAPENENYSEGLQTYTSMLEELCNNLEFDENEIYADYYLEETGLLEQ